MTESRTDRGVEAREAFLEWADPDGLFRPAFEQHLDAIEAAAASRVECTLPHAARTNAALVERVEGLRKAAHIGIEALFGECRHDPALGTATDCDVLASAVLTAAEPADPDAGPWKCVVCGGLGAHTVIGADDIPDHTFRPPVAAEPAGPAANMNEIMNAGAAEPAGEQGTAEPARLYEDTPESEAAWRKYAADRPRRTGPRRGGFMPEGTERTPGEPAL
jgi:hypothetical protein